MHLFRTLARVGLVTVLAILLSACQFTAPVENQEPQGEVYNVSELNGQTVTVSPGDVLTLKLSGEGGTGAFWQVKSPTSTPVVELQDQKIENLNELHTTATFEWEFLIVEIGDFELTFDYGKIGQEPIDSFTLNVISQTRDEI